MGKVAFLFAGRAPSTPACARTSSSPSPRPRPSFDAADAVRPGTTEQCLSGTKEELAQTINTQPCVFAADLACARALAAHGVRPDVVAGFSLGEVAALTFAGAYTDEQGFELVCHRAELMADAAEKNPGAHARRREARRPPPWSASPPRRASSAGPSTTTARSRPSWRARPRHARSSTPWSKEANGPRDEGRRLRRLPQARSWRRPSAASRPTLPTATRRPSPPCPCWPTARRGLPGRRGRAHGAALQPGGQPRPVGPHPAEHGRRRRGHLHRGRSRQDPDGPRHPHARGRHRACRARPPSSSRRFSPRFPRGESRHGREERGARSRRRAPRRPRDRRLPRHPAARSPRARRRRL